MINTLYNFMPFRNQLKRLGVSESKASEAAGISRLTWRSVVAGKTTVELKSVRAVANHLGLILGLMAWPAEQDVVSRSELSTVGISLMVSSDGFESWKIHFMNFVDDCYHPFVNCPLS